MKKRLGFTLIELMIVISIISILMIVLLPNMVRMRAEARVQGCCDNMHHLAIALESYSAENSTHYPTALSLITPKYISVIPTCASSGSNEQYVAGYSAQSNPDEFTIMCRGTFHNDIHIPSDYPQYTPHSGLRRKP